MVETFVSELLLTEVAKEAVPEFQFRVGCHVPHGELAGAALDISGLGWVPCRSVGCGH